MEFVFSYDIFITLITLTFMEIVLGIDNLVFLSIVSSRLPYQQQPKARRIGLILALGMRILLLFSISYIANMKEPLFTIMGQAFSWRDLILLAGGVFLLYKAASEIHLKFQGEEDGQNIRTKNSFTAVLVQIVLLDIVFSFDSILTAIGLSNHIWVMVTAVIISIIVMLLFVESISLFIKKHPTMKVLALSFLLLIGVLLVAESLHYHVNKNYVYVTIFFSVAVEILNIRIREATEGKGESNEEIASGEK